MRILSSNSPDAREYLTQTCADYSAEAINERDPAHRGWSDNAQFETIADLSHDVRLDLARCLEQLGMPAARAAAIAQA